MISSILTRAASEKRTSIFEITSKEIALTEQTLKTELDEKSFILTLERLLRYSENANAIPKDKTEVYFPSYLFILIYFHFTFAAYSLIHFYYLLLV